MFLINNVAVLYLYIIHITVICYFQNFTDIITKPETIHIIFGMQSLDYLMVYLQHNYTWVFTVKFFAHTVVFNVAFT